MGQAFRLMSAKRCSTVSIASPAPRTADAAWDFRS